MSCEDYFTNGWCTAEGANGEQFSKLSYNYDFQEASLGKRIGEFTALNCPQCGCVTGYVADTTIEYVEDKEFDFAVKVEENQNEHLMNYKTSDEYCDCFVVNKPDGLVRVKYLVMALFINAISDIRYARVISPRLLWKVC